MIATRKNNVLATQAAISNAQMRLAGGQLRPQDRFSSQIKILSLTALPLVIAAGLFIQSEFSEKPMPEYRIQQAIKY